ncbi:MAG TPA: heat-inducible transcriptional repressor HrcA [Bacilli bacterium]|nr:MAG: Heat-inducible transcription repressor HrcA [Tenericutes bacterium ADurb.BinA124]HNZ50821.1 heat-inducible transcriptional repressor HrcA [Bacilli bacterium]HPN61143.1 heat-inducible transcriptional repressor HrcA [Bacilli bacterium]HPX84871.1 heat-inducible transcriptional repressor HrcA [Bacilli bacterium]HQC74859.1 heat-inducible transcriptional repressor HrcA [Bacilli bacterium]
MLSTRQTMVLKAIVEEYVKTNEPVGSKTLTSRPEFALNVSPATIRNDMAELEQYGLILKTHTSSGRIPSEEGYRVYVQEILNKKTPEIKEFPLIDEIFERDLISREQAIKESMALVTELTNYAAVVLGAASYNAKIKNIQFISLTERYAVIMLVTDHGYVESKKIIVPEDISIRDIERTIDFLNDILFDCPISRIDEKIKQYLEDDNFNAYISYYDDLISALVRMFTEMVQDKYFLSGQSKILSQPEFQNIGKVQDLLTAIEQREIIKAVDMSERGISVRIGRDNQIQAMRDCTVITVPYELENGERGAIAVIGPTRMEYQKVIPLLEYIAKNIKKVI